MIENTPHIISCMTYLFTVPRTRETFDSQYTVEDSIGTGASGVSKLVKHRITGALVS